METMENLRTTVRKGTQEDLPQVLDLIKELALYEKAPQEVTNTLEMMREDGFGKNPVYGLFVAETGSRITGIAIYYTKYSTWKGRCIFLEDIIVTEELRGKGIGRMLFEEVIKVSRDSKAARMEWQVLEWNTPAIEFYKKFDAILDPEWINGKLTREQLERFSF
jgi:GNAT superfamily N-acetyltransferase